MEVLQSAAFELRYLRMASPMRAEANIGGRHPSAPSGLTARTFPAGGGRRTRPRFPAALMPRILERRTLTDVIAGRPRHRLRPERASPGNIEIVTVVEPD